MPLPAWIQSHFNLSHWPSWRTTRLRKIPIRLPPSVVHTHLKARAPSSLQTDLWAVSGKKKKKSFNITHFNLSSTDPPFLENPWYIRVVRWGLWWWGQFPCGCKISLSPSWGGRNYWHAPQKPSGTGSKVSGARTLKTLHLRESYHLQSLPRDSRFYRWKWLTVSWWFSLIARESAVSASHGVKAVWNILGFSDN